MGEGRKGAVAGCGGRPGPASTAAFPRSGQSMWRNARPSSCFSCQRPWPRWPQVA